jgi:hypothetical protein
MLYSQAWLLNFEMAFALAPGFFWMPPVVILVGYRYPLDFGCQAIELATPY